ncbi:lipase [Cnuella takakiae]|nr:lipase [Cnuella takakiae]
MQPSKAKPAWGPTLTQQMQAVIETLDTIAPAPIESLTPEQARLQPGPTEAVMRVMNNFRIPMPLSGVDTMGREIPVAGGTIHARVYTPRTGRSNYPLIVYYHGGGWVIATIDTYNASAQALAEKTDAVVVSVEYRKGPEFKFPTAHQDAYAAYQWAVENAASLRADSAKVATAGESAGGNLAVNVAIMARDNGYKMPRHILSVYPVASNDLSLPSKITYAAAKPLNTPMLPWFLGHYLNSMDEAANPMINLLAADVSGLPTTTIINAEIDPLETEGALLTDKMRAAGVDATRQLYTGVTHEFFGMATVVPEAKAAQDFAASRLKASLQ